MLDICVCQGFRFQILTSQPLPLHNHIIITKFFCLMVPPLHVYFVLSGAFLSKTARIVSVKLSDHFYQIYKFLYLPKIYHYQNLIIALGYCLRLKFLKSHFEFCYCQQMKIGKYCLKNITLLEVTGFVW